VKTGKLDTPIVLLKEVTTVNASRDVETSYQAFARPYAHLTHRDVVKSDSAQRERAKARIRFSMRYSPQVAEVDSKSVVLFNGKHHEIVGIKRLPLGRPRELIIDTEIDADV
jgi:head-tail adaptor